MSRHLIVGLGNPGPKYAKTRHNIGFMALDRLAERYGMAATNIKFDAHFDTGRVGEHQVVLLKPQTFMNRSGKSVQAAANFYDIAPDKIIVLHDEIDLKPAQLRLKSGGGHGGHNGLRDIIKMLGSRDFLRVRLGIGRPKFGDVSDYVLGRFTRIEKVDVADLIEDGCDAVEALLQDGLESAQNRFH